MLLCQRNNLHLRKHLWCYTINCRSLHFPKHKQGKCKNEFKQKNQLKGKQFSNSEINGDEGENAIRVYVGGLLTVENSGPNFVKSCVNTFWRHLHFFYETAFEGWRFYFVVDFFFLNMSIRWQRQNNNAGYSPKKGSYVALLIWETFAETET